MRISRIATGAVALGMTAVLITACSSGDSSGGSSSGVVNAWAGEPQNPLIPTNTSENMGGRVLDSLFSGLVSYTADGGTENEVAESIESTDGQNFTVKLKDGWTFTDGTPVTAKSFVDAWNYGALSTNAQLQASFFDPIKGYDEVAAEVPTAQTMSGLKVVDDSTFTIELKQPESAFPDRLGFTAYYPLPEVAFKDMTAFGENPIGNGPYKLDGTGAWQHNVRIDTVVNPDYNGNRKPKNAGVDFIMYNSLDTAYTDLLANNVDVLDQVPPSAVTTFESDLPGRTVNQPSATIETFTIPGRLPHFSGEEGMLRRQAISMAIDRTALAGSINLSGWVTTTRVVNSGLTGDNGTIGERWAGRSIEERRALATARVAQWRSGSRAAPVLRIAIPTGPGGDILFARFKADLASIGVEARRVASDADADLRLIDAAASYGTAQWFFNRLSCANQPAGCSPAADKLAGEALAEPDPAKQAELASQAEAQLTVANGYIPLGVPVRWSLVGGSVTGFATNRLAVHPLMSLAMLPK